MTATLHIGRRTTPHHPLAAFTTWLTRLLPGSGKKTTGITPDTMAAFVEAMDIEALRLSLPLDDPDRHALENPAVEDAFAHLADACPVKAPAFSMRPADREELLLATCDAWFRHAHPAPEHRWSPDVRAEYELLLDSVRRCFHPGGAE